jgi:hypothetical protein
MGSTADSSAGRVSSGQLRGQASVRVCVETDRISTSTTTTTTHSSSSSTFEHAFGIGPLRPVDDALLDFEVGGHGVDSRLVCGAGIKWSVTGASERACVRGD